MHPTRISVVFKLNLSGGRVIGGVRPLVMEHKFEWSNWVVLQKGKQLRVAHGRDLVS
jgi:hypothetical protein